MIILECFNTHTQARIIISDHLKKDEDKDVKSNKEINLNNKNPIGVKNSKQIKPLSSFQLTVITGKNIAIRNNENSILNLQTESQILDQKGYDSEGNVGTDKIEIMNSREEAMINNNENENEDKSEDIDNDSSTSDSDSSYSDSDSDSDSNNENDDDSTYPISTSKAYTLTEEVQRVLIEDFYPPISSSTVPGNSGRLYISLSSSSSSTSSPSSSSSTSTSTSTPLRFSPIDRDGDVDDGDGVDMDREENE